MAGTAKQWLIGCGIGCGLMVVLGLGLGAAGWYGVRHVAKRAETLEAASDSLATKFGPPEAWAPPLDGGLDPARIEAFLEARRLMAPERERTANNLAVLDGSKGSSVPAKIAAGVDFVPRLLGFIEERDRALLQVDMGPGEYMYLYSVAYFGLLAKDPGDGPGFHLAGDGAEDRGHSWSFGKQGESGDGRVEIGGSGGSGDSGDEAKREECASSASPTSGNCSTACSAKTCAGNWRPSMRPATGSRARPGARRWRPNWRRWRPIPRDWPGSRDCPSPPARRWSRSGPGSKPATTA
ncbi:MAG: hypothetical protein IPH86_10915 [bacterium]|nr:hypothetical protein [bacterium]